jgi:hypothetical protein
MSNEIENELESVKLKYSDADVEYVLNVLFEETEYEPLIQMIKDKFADLHIKRMENGNV